MPKMRRESSVSARHQVGISLAELGVPTNNMKRKSEEEQATKVEEPMAERIQRGLSPTNSLGFIAHMALGPTTKPEPDRELEALSISLKTLSRSKRKCNSLTLIS
ncbi:unnamed protein product [Linum trigynum]|uniref:Uncharacterized protein n=1 Tax=Linum trigynum TaxID=586398 RepID=A0AAV2GSP7_9ROSI